MSPKFVNKFFEENIFEFLLQKSYMYIQTELSKVVHPPKKVFLCVINFEVFHRPIFFLKQFQASSCRLIHKKKNFIFIYIFMRWLKQVNKFEVKMFAFAVLSTRR